MVAMHTSIFCYYQDWHEKPDRTSLRWRGYQVSQTVWSISWSKGYSIPLLTPVIPPPFNSINCFKESSPCSQIKNTSSIYLHCMRGCISMSHKILSPRSAINRIAYSGTNFVPIAVPLNCFKVFFIELKDVVL